MLHQSIHGLPSTSTSTTLPQTLPSLILFKDPDPHYTTTLSPYVASLEFVPLLRPHVLPLDPPPTALLTSSNPVAWIFTSKHAAATFLPYLQTCTAPSTFFAVGEASAKPLVQAGYPVLGTHTKTAVQLAQFLLQHWSPQHPSTEYVFVTGQEHREELPMLLKENVPLSILIVYGMGLEDIDDRSLDTNAVWVLFSPRGAYHVHNRRQGGWSKRIIAIGPSTAQAIREVGYMAEVAPEPSADGVLSVLKQAFLEGKYLEKNPSDFVEGEAF